jgi:hypothetical protein
MQEGLDMEQELFERASNIFGRIAQTEECSRKISDYEHVYQFEIEGKPSFYVELNRGVLTTSLGLHPGDVRKVSLVKTDSATLWAILKGKLRPLDASKEGTWVIRARNYSGELLYTLLRIGREIAIGDMLAAQA